MRAYLAPCSLQARTGAALALLLLCMSAAVPFALAGPRCSSGMLCPDEGWYCCHASRESCCKNIGTGGPFGRKLRMIEMQPSADPLLPPTFSIWQGGELLHTTSNGRRLAQSDEGGQGDTGDKGAPDTSVASVAQAGSQLSARHDTSGNPNAPANSFPATTMQLAMAGTATGRGPVPSRVITEGFYTARDTEVRPWVGGDSRLEDWPKNKILGPLSRQQGLLRRGEEVGKQERKKSRMAPAGK